MPSTCRNVRVIKMILCVWFTPATTARYCVIAERGKEQKLVLTDFSFSMPYYSFWIWNFTHTSPLPALRMGVPVSYASKLQGNIFCLDPLKHFGASDSALGSLSQSPADPSPRQDGETFWPCPALPLPSQDISGAAFYKVGSTGRVFFLLFLPFHAFNRWTPFTIGSRRQRKKNGIRRWRS